MEGIEKIKKKIMNDADSQVKEIVKEAEKEIQKINDNNKRKLDDYKKHFDERTNAMIKFYEQKTLALARLKVKKENLLKREDIINNFMDKITDYLKGKEYKDFLKAILKSVIKDLGENLKIKCNKNDVKTVKEIAEKEGINADVNEIEITGGMIFEDEQGRKINESLAIIIERKRNQIRQKIVKIIGE